MTGGILDLMAATGARGREPYTAADVADSWEKHEFADLLKSANAPFRSQKIRHAAAYCDEDAFIRANQEEELR